MQYRSLHGYKYELMDEYRIPVMLPSSIAVPDPYVYISEGYLVIKKYYTWDGPSGPSIDTPSFMRGSLVHDALYQLMREGQLSKEYKDYADNLLRQICLEDGMSKFRAWYVYQAVHTFGQGSLKLEKNPRGQVIEL